MSTNIYAEIVGLGLLISSGGFMGRYLMSKLDQRDDLIKEIIMKFDISLKDIAEELKDLKLTLKDKDNKQ